MNVRFADKALDRLETDPRFAAGLPQAVVKAYRRRIWQIRAVTNERNLRLLSKGNRFEKLKGNRSHQYSLKLNDQFRLIIEIEGEANNKTIVIVSVEDYH